MKQKNKIIKIKEENKLKLSVKTWTSLNLGFKYFNPPQSKFVSEKLHQKDCNVIVAWSTSAGKTVTAELTIEHQFKKKKKVIYACPLKALAEEKIKRFKKLFPDKNIEIFTGDYNNFDRRKTKAQNADLAIVTTELLDSITRNQTLTKFLLYAAGTVIIDEFHIIATDRGPAVESALIRLPKHISILLLSATLPNTKDVAEWIYNLNKKETYIFESSFRPVKIDWNIIHIDYKKYASWLKHGLQHLNQLIHELLQSEEQGQILIFVWTKPVGYRIKQMLDYEGIPCHFHNASLTLEDRNNFEEDFECGKIKVLIATTTLAWGKNTSARYVIIFGDKRGFEYIDGWDVIQMGGRAGRMGYTPKGDVFWYVSSKNFAEEVLNNPPSITSKLIIPENLAFHVIGEIPFYRSTEINTIVSWFKKTFASNMINLQQSYSVLNQAFDILIDKTKCVGYDSEKREVFLTKLGVIAKRFYLDPKEVWAWYKMLRILSNEFQFVDTEIFKPYVAFMLFFAHTDSKNGLYLSKEEREKIDELYETYPEFRKFAYLFLGEIHSFISMTAYDWYKQNINALLSEGKRMNPYYKVRDFIYDIERIGSACSAMALEIFKNKKLADNINKMTLILKYGVPTEVYELLKINGIGTVRAVKLFNLNIFNIKTLVNELTKGNKKIKEFLPDNVI